MYSTINDYDNLYKKLSDYLKGQFDAILDINELFIDGEDMVLYYNDNDLISKVDYYLSREEERRKIAANGKKKIMDMFGYTNANMI